MGGARQAVAARGAKYQRRPVIQASHADLGERWFYTDNEVPLLFTENEINNQRLFGGQNASAYVKDGINDYVVGGRQEAVNGSSGTKVAAYHRFHVKANDTVSTILRLTVVPPEKAR